MSFDVEIGARIRTVREQYGYSREKFAELADISSSFVAHFENGQKGISAETLAKICKALRLSADYLLFGQEYGGSDRTAAQALARLQTDERQDVERIFLDAVKILNETKTEGEG